MDRSAAAKAAPSGTEGAHGSVYPRLRTPSVSSTLSSAAAVGQHRSWGSHRASQHVPIAHARHQLRLQPRCALPVDPSAGESSGRDAHIDGRAEMGAPIGTKPRDGTPQPVATAPTEADIMALLEACGAKFTMDRLSQEFQSVSHQTSYNPTRQELRDMLLGMVQKGLLVNSGGVFRRGRTQYYDRSSTPWFDLYQASPKDNNHSITDRAPHEASPAPQCNETPAPASNYDYSPSPEPRPSSAPPGTIMKMEGAFLKLLKQHSILPLDRIHYFLKFMDDYSLDMDELRVLADYLAKEGKIAQTNGWYSQNIGRQPTPVGSRAAAVAAAKSRIPPPTASQRTAPPPQSAAAAAAPPRVPSAAPKRPVQKPPEPAAPKPSAAEGSRSAPTPSRTSEPSAPAPTKPPALKAAPTPPAAPPPPAKPEKTKPRAEAAPPASVQPSKASASAAPRSERRSLEAKRLAALNLLKREFESGVLSAVEFAREAEVIETEFASLVSELAPGTEEESDDKPPPPPSSGRIRHANRTHTPVVPPRPPTPPAARAPAPPQAKPRPQPTSTASDDESPAAYRSNSPSPEAWASEPPSTRGAPAAKSSKAKQSQHEEEEDDEEDKSPVSEQEMEEKLEMLRGALSQVQAVVRGLKSKVRSKDTKPESERARLSRELAKSRSVLKQLRETLVYYGEEVPSEDEEEFDEEDEDAPSRSGRATSASRDAPGLRAPPPTPTAGRPKADNGRGAASYAEQLAQSDRAVTPSLSRKTGSGPAPPPAATIRPSEADPYRGVQEEDIEALQQLLDLELQERGDWDAQAGGGRTSAPADTPQPRPGTPGSASSPSRRNAPRAARMPSPQPMRSSSGSVRPPPLDDLDEEGLRPPSPSRPPSPKRAQPGRASRSREEEEEEQPDVLRTASTQDFATMAGAPTQVLLPEEQGSRARTPRPGTPKPRDRTPTPVAPQRRAATPPISKTRFTPLHRTSRARSLDFVVAQQVADNASSSTHRTLEHPEDGSYLALIEWCPEPPPAALEEASQGGGGPGPSSSDSDLKVSVRFSLPYRVAFGQVIKIAGDCYEFGNWSVEDALLMKWTEGDVWVAEAQLSPGQYELKAVVRNTITKEVSWEAGTNHVLEVPNRPGILFGRWPWATGQLEMTFVPTPEAPSQPPDPKATSPTPDGGGWSPGGGRGAGLASQGPPTSLESRLGGETTERSTANAGSAGGRGGAQASSAAAAAKKRKPTPWAKLAEDGDDEDGLARGRAVVRKAVGASGGLTRSEGAGEEGPMVEDEREDEWAGKSVEELEMEQAQAAANGRKKKRSPSPWRELQDPALKGKLLAGSLDDDEEGEGGDEEGRGGQRGTDSVGTAVEFMLDYPSEPGEIIKLVGSNRIFGAGDPDMGATMLQIDEAEWMYRCSLPPGVYDLKAVVMNSSRPPRWEPGPRRQIHIPLADAVVRVWCDWGSDDLDYDLDGVEVTRPGYVSEDKEEEEEEEAPREKQKEKEAEASQPTVKPGSGAWPPGMSIGASSSPSAVSRPADSVSDGEDGLTTPYAGKITAPPGTVSTPLDVPPQRRPSPSGRRSGSPSPGRARGTPEVSTPSQGKDKASYADASSAPSAKPKSIWGNLSQQFKTLPGNKPPLDNDPDFPPPAKEDKPAKQQQQQQQQPTQDAADKLVPQPKQGASGQPGHHPYDSEDYDSDGEAADIRDTQKGNVPAASKGKGADKDAAAEKVAERELQAAREVVVAASQSGDGEDVGMDERVRQWRQESAGRMLSELKMVARQLQAGLLTRAQFEKRSQALREKWVEEVLVGPGGSGADAAAIPVISRPPSSGQSGKPATGKANRQWWERGMTPELSRSATPEDEPTVSNADTAVAPQDTAVSVPAQKRDGTADWNEEDEAAAIAVAASALQMEEVPQDVTDVPTPAGESEGGSADEVDDALQYLDPYRQQGDTELAGALEMDTDTDGMVEYIALAPGANVWEWHRGGVVGSEPPVSPYGFECPPEILALRPGQIFSMEVLRSALYHAEVLDIVPAETLDGTWHPSQPISPKGWPTFSTYVARGMVPGMQPEKKVEEEEEAIAVKRNVENKQDKKDDKKKEEVKAKKESKPTPTPSPEPEPDPVPIPLPAYSTSTSATSVWGALEPSPPAAAAKDAAPGDEDDDEDADPPPLRTYRLPEYTRPRTRGPETTPVSATAAITGLWKQLYTEIRREPLPALEGYESTITPAEVWGVIVNKVSVPQVNAPALRTDRSRSPSPARGRSTEADKADPPYVTRLFTPETAQPVERDRRREDSGKRADRAPAKLPEGRKDAEAGGSAGADAGVRERSMTPVAGPPKVIRSPAASNGSASGSKWGLPLPWGGAGENTGSAGAGGLEAGWLLSAVQPPGASGSGTGGGGGGVDSGERSPSPASYEQRPQEEEEDWLLRIRKALPDQVMNGPEMDAGMDESDVRAARAQGGSNPLEVPWYMPNLWPRRSPTPPRGPSPQVEARQPQQQRPPQQQQQQQQWGSQPVQEPPQQQRPLLQPMSPPPEPPPPPPPLQQVVERVQEREQPVKAEEVRPQVEERKQEVVEKEKEEEQESEEERERKRKEEEEREERLRLQGEKRLRERLELELLERQLLREEKMRRLQQKEQLQQLVDKERERVRAVEQEQERMRAAEEQRVREEEETRARKQREEEEEQARVKKQREEQEEQARAKKQREEEEAERERVRVKAETEEKQRAKTVWEAGQWRAAQDALKRQRDDYQQEQLRLRQLDEEEEDQRQLTALLEQEQQKSRAGDDLTAEQERQRQREAEARRRLQLEVEAAQLLAAKQREEEKARRQLEQDAQRRLERMRAAKEQEARDVAAANRLLLQKKAGGDEDGGKKLQQIASKAAVLQKSKVDPGDAVMSQNGDGRRRTSGTASPNGNRDNAYVAYEQPEVLDGQVLVKLSMRFVTSASQVLRFVGGRPEFGAWNPSDAPAFYWIQGDMWVADVALWPGYYQFKPVVLDLKTGEAEWESGPMRTLTVPDKKGGGTLLLNCNWGDFDMEAKFYFDRVKESDGTVRYSTEIIKMESTMDIDGMQVDADVE